MENDQDLTLNNNKSADAQGTPSGSQESAGASSSGDVKTVTPDRSQRQSDAVPYERFREVQDKAKRADELEEALSEHRDKVYRDPLTGKLRLKFEAKKAEPDDDEKEEEDTEEEKLLFDEQQRKFIRKLLDRTASRVEKRTTKSVFNSYNTMAKDQQERTKFINQAVSKFPELDKPDSEIRKEYLKILQEEFTETLPNGAKYVAPKSIMDCAIKAAWIIKEREEQKTKDLGEAKKMGAQNTFVSKTSKSAPEPKGELSEEEFENLSEEEQRAYGEREFEKLKAKGFE